MIDGNSVQSVYQGISSLKQTQPNCQTACLTSEVKTLHWPTFNWLAEKHSWNITVIKCINFLSLLVEKDICHFHKFY